MSINLLDILKSEVGDQILSHASRFLGESESATGKALGSVFPSLLGSMIEKGSDRSGAGELFDLLGNHDGSILDNIGGLFAGGSSAVNGLLNGGSGILQSLLGDKLGGVVDLIASVSGLKKGSSSSLLKMAAPFIMGVIGKHIRKNGLDVGGLMDLLSGQKSHVKSALPSGMGDLLGLSGLGFGDRVRDALEDIADTGKDLVDGASDLVGDAADAVGRAGRRVAAGAQDVAEDAVDTGRKVLDKTADVAEDAVDAGKKVGGSLLKWLIPALLLLLLLGFLGRRGCKTGVDTVDNTAETVVNTTENVADGAANVVREGADAVGDAVVATGDFIGGVLNTVNDAALSALRSIRFAAGSAGDRLYKFIQGGAKGENRFRFSNLTFEEGSANITGETAREIDNVAVILKAYPGLRMVVEGHTDNTGSDEVNMNLSNARAGAVKGRLIAQGIDGERILAKGYGSTRPVASNDTAEGREQNRRIELRIIR